MIIQVFADLHVICFLSVLLVWLWAYLETILLITNHQAQLSLLCPWGRLIEYQPTGWSAFTCVGCHVVLCDVV